MNFTLSKPLKLSFVIFSIIFLQNCKKNSVPNNDAKTFVVSTFVGNSNRTTTDGTGTAASFAQLGNMMTIDANGNLFVADGMNGTIRKITSDGIVTTFITNTLVNGYYNGFLVRCNGLVADLNGNIIITNDSGYVVKIAATGIFNPIIPYTIGEPFGITSDGSGNFYIACNSPGLIRKITSTGTGTTIAGSGQPEATIDGTGTSASFIAPTGICIDSKGNLFVTDRDDNKIRKITPAGVVTTFAGSANKGSADGMGQAASFFEPWGIAIDASDNLYVADAGNRIIRMITPDAKVTTIAGTAGKNGNTDGSGSVATFGSPAGIAIDKKGNIYVSDPGYNVIRKITFQ